VIAGAGYGKTTLIAQTVKQTGWIDVWYSLDRSDMDFATFMNYLIQGFQNHYPIAEEIHRDLLDGAFTSRKSREDFLIRFLSLIENNIHEKIIMVLDDYYWVQNSPEIRESVELMLERLPLSVHMVIISRIEPNLPISRLRVMQEVLEIDERELQFTQSEIKELFLDLFDIPVSREDIEILHKKTSGWAASLTLFYYILKREKGHENVTRLDRLKGSHKYIFEYLEENIFEIQPLETKNFMLKTSLLSRLDTKFCNTLLKIKNSRELLDQLEKNHLLTFPLDEDRRVYHYHHLLKDFLQAKLDRLFDKKDVQNLHYTIARLLEKSGEEYEALEHYLDGEHFKEAVKLIGTLELRLLLEGRLRFIRNCLDKIPDSIIQNTPQLQYIEAKLYSLSGKPYEAIFRLKAALKKFEEEKSQENVKKCLTDLGLHYYYTGNIRQAELQLKKLFNEKEHDSVVSFEIIGLLILFSAILGKLDTADEYANTAQGILKGLEEPVKILADAWINLSYSYKFYISGDFLTSHQINLRLLEQFKRQNAEIVLPLAHFQTSATCYYLRQYHKGFEHAQAGIRIAEKKGIYDSQAGWLYYAYALNVLGLGKIEDAMAYAEESLNIFITQDNLWGQANSYDLLHLVCMKAGKRAAQAEQYIRAGLKIIEGLDLPVTEGILETGLAGVLIEQKTYEKVPDLLKTAQEKLNISKFYTFKICLLNARCHLENGRKREALEKLEVGLNIAEANGYHLFFENEETWILSLMVEFFSMGKKKSLLEKILTDIGGSFKNAFVRLHEIQKPRIGRAASNILIGKSAVPLPDLNIHLLGKFRVFLGNEEIPSDRWKSSKALMIFKYLAAKRRQGFIHREILIELLWPEGNYKKTNKRFNVAMSSLRKLLEPELKPRSPSSYVMRQKETFSLHTGDGGKVDVEEFYRELELGNKSGKTDPEISLMHYLNAESCFNGPFLVEDPYVDWCIKERETLNEKYLHVLLKIIQFYDRKKDFLKCIEYANKYLSVDNYSEDIFRKLMLFHSMTGNISNVKKTFEKCEINIVEKLECPLSQETLDLYNRLIQNKK
jgi:ATP/maltotriose-dependent transcriptional regulator MalT/DNA-binding SARP family transcriptional activator